MKLLFASTARAGRWNHRYLVPTGEIRSDTELASFIAQSDDHIAKVSHKVTQQNGREGDEILVFADSRLAQLDPHALTCVNELLKQRLSTLEHLVTKEINWDREPPSVVPCNELKAMHEEFEAMLTSLSTSSASKSRMSRIKVAGVGVFIVGVVVLFVSLVSGQISFPRIRVPTPQQPDVDPHVRDLAELLGFPLKSTQDKLCGRLATHLESHLFVDRQPHNQPDTSKPESKDESKYRKPGQDRLEVIMKLFGEAIGKGNVEWTDKGLIHPLKTLFPKPKIGPAPNSGHDLDPYGMITTPVNKTKCKDIKPQQLRNIVEALQKLIQSVQPLTPPKEADIYDKFFAEIKKTRRIRLSDVGPTNERNVLRRNFFLDKDLTALDQLDDLLKNETLVKLYGERVSQPPDNQNAEQLQANSASPPVDSLMRFAGIARAKQNNNTWLHLDKLKEEANRNEGNEKQKAFEALKHFVETCSEPPSDISNPVGHSLPK